MPSARRAPYGLLAAAYSLRGIIDLARQGLLLHPHFAQASEGHGKYDTRNLKVKKKIASSSSPARMLFETPTFLVSFGIPFSPDPIGIFCTLNSRFWLQFKVRHSFFRRSGIHSSPLFPQSMSQVQVTVTGSATTAKVHEFGPLARDDSIATGRAAPITPTTSKGMVVSYWPVVVTVNEPKTSCIFNKLVDFAACI